MCGNYRDNGSTSTEHPLYQLNFQSSCGLAKPFLDTLAVILSKKNETAREIQTPNFKPLLCKVFKKLLKGLIIYQAQVGHSPVSKHNCQKLMCHDRHYTKCGRVTFSKIGNSHWKVMIFSKIFPYFIAFLFDFQSKM